MTLLIKTYECVYENNKFVGIEPTLEVWEITAQQIPHNPFDQLSYIALLFLKERTDFNEPFAGFGFATQMKNEIEKAFSKK